LGIMADIVRIFNSLFVKLLSAEPRMKKTADQSAMDVTIGPSDPVSWMASMACVRGSNARLDGIGGLSIDTNHCDFISS
jgi:hypothetical protein